MESKIHAREAPEAEGEKRARSETDAPAPVRPHLIYFEGRGRAEPTRLLFEECGVEYTDERIPMEGWTEKKEQYPFGQLPILRVGQFEIPQSTAILRYAAKRFGHSLFPGNDEAQARADAMTEAAEDFLNNIVYKSISEKSSAADKEKIVKEELPKWLNYFKNQLGEHQFFVENTFSYADLAVYTVLHEIEAFHAGSLAPVAPLAQFKDRIAARPKIAAWLARRPTSFW
ncbi:putative Glutathione S-transferase 1 [Paratrimastix pyriformis]|uniref:Glutathione S-transferase 1 n=1 Tax=Paratrimastix pyriformis TaxID=342808 RepID=A0ABQ8UQQ1_9EUKA|nr:putative Glutathione S-transferase 1 [Paratrimastix pyriformis]|eukprot:GAFH01004395.1.p1 GENE.GAFH01004395.1~~GAFH01004395.1.p1  ORF type:complete len:229 (-),score=61.17 GAFH01004395.1:84-770(-)